MAQRSRRRSGPAKAPDWVPEELLVRLGELSHDEALARDARKSGRRWADALDALLAPHGGAIAVTELERPLDVVLAEHGIGHTTLSLLRNGFPMTFALPAVRRFLAGDDLEPLAIVEPAEGEDDLVESPEDSPREQHKLREKDRKLREERDAHARTRSELTSQRDQALHRVAELERRLAEGPSGALVEEMQAARAESMAEAEQARAERDAAMATASDARALVAGLRGDLERATRAASDTRRESAAAIEDAHRRAGEATPENLLRVARQIAAASALRLGSPASGDPELFEALAALTRWARAAHVVGGEHDAPGELAVEPSRAPTVAVARPSAIANGRGHNDRRLTVIAGGGLGASAYLVEHAGHRVLLDCGIPESALPAVPLDLDLAILTHAHADHMFGLAALLRGRPDLRAICSKPTKRLAMDQANSVDDFLPGDRILVRDPGETYRLLGGELELTLHRVAHCLGSCAVRLRFRDGFTLVYSGDLGGGGLRTLRPTEPLPLAGADAVVLEATLGDRGPTRTNWETSLIREAGATVAAGGAAVFPSGSLGRAQELAAMFGDGIANGALPAAPIWMTPLAKRILDRYRRGDRDGWLATPEYPEVRTLRPEVLSTDLVSEPGYLIIGGASAADGRSAEVVRAAAVREPCGVFFTSYSGAIARHKTRGDQLEVKGADGTVEQLTIACRWGWFPSPDHPSREELVASVSRLDGRVPILLVHGVEEAKRQVAERLREKGHVDVRALTDGAVVEFA